MLEDRRPGAVKTWKSASLGGIFDQEKAIELSVWLATANEVRGGRSHLRSS